MKEKIRKNLKRWGSIFAALFMIIGILPVSTTNVFAKNSKIVTLEVLTNQSEDAMEPYKEQFESLYPNVKIQYVKMSNYDEDCMKKIQSGSYGDVLFVPGSVQYSDYDKYFVNLGNASDFSKKYNFMEQSKRSVDSVYGIPSVAYANGIVYNKAVFEKAGITDTPKDINTFLQDLKLIKENTSAMPFFTNYNEAWALGTWETFPFIEMTGDKTYKANKFVNIENPYTMDSTHGQVYNLLYMIVKDGLCESDITKGNWEKSKNMLNEGKIGCMAIGSWAIKQFKDAGPNGDDIAFMPFPNVVDGIQYSTILTDYCYAISKKSKHQAEARNYIDFMIDQSGYAKDNDEISIVKTDALADSYKSMNDVQFLSNSGADLKNSGKFETLSSQLNLSDGTEQKRIMEAAAGKSKEDLNSIFADWNKRWESSRTSDMKTDNESSILSEDEILTDNTKVEFSDTEKAYKDQAGELKVGYVKDYAPFQEMTSGNDFKGVSAEVCQIVSKTAGLKFRYVPYDTFDDMIDALNKGNLDIIAGMEKSDANSDKLHFSKEYAYCNNVLVSNGNTNTGNIKDQKAAIVKGFVNSYYQGVTNKVEASSMEEALSDVNSKKAAYTITNYYTANYYMQLKELNDLTLVPMSSQEKLCMVFANNADSRLISICNKCLYSIQSEKVELALMQNMEQAEKGVTLKRLVERYPVQSILIVVAVLGAIIGILFALFLIKKKSNKKHELDVKRYRLLADLTNEYIFDYDCVENKITLDQQFKNRFGANGPVDLNQYDGSNETYNTFLTNMNRLIENEHEHSMDVELMHEDGTKNWYRMDISRMRDETGKTINIIGKLTDIQHEVTERKEMMDKAEKDPLTGIFNRDGYWSLIDKTMAGCSPDGAFAIGIMDFDNFKKVNDSLGHDGGDAVLCLLAKEAEKIFGKNGVAARFGGDEFVMFIPNVTNPSGVKEQAESMVHTMAREFTYGDKKIQLSISMGVVIAANKEAPKEALKRADQILYQVKEKGKNSYKLENYA